MPMNIQANIVGGSTDHETLSHHNDMDMIPNLHLTMAKARLLYGAASIGVALSRTKLGSRQRADTGHETF